MGNKGARDVAEASPVKDYSRVRPGLNLANAQTNHVITSVVAFANGELSPVGHGRDTVPIIGSIGDPDAPDAVRDFHVAVAQAKRPEHIFAVQMLEAAEASYTALNNFIIDSIGTGHRSLARLGGKLVVVDGAPHLQTNEVRGDPYEWVMHAAVTLASSARGDETDIGRCRLKSCSKFFVIQRGRVGKPAKRYCSENHRLDQHAIEAGERKRNSRLDRRERLRAATRRRR